MELTPLWLTLVGESESLEDGAIRREKENGMGADGFAVIALILTITNTIAFSRCDKFSQASNLASSAFGSGNLARNVAGGLVSRLWTR